MTTTNDSSPAQDPEYYLLRLGSGEYAVLPFVETVCELLDREDQWQFGRLSAQEALDLVRGHQVSVVMDSEEWDVQWRHGATLDLATLETMR